MRRNGSVVREADGLAEDPVQFPSSHHGGSQLSVTPVLEDLMPSSELLGQQVFMHTHSNNSKN